ncbi:MAG: helix-turn-helix domain-containing protein [Chloroflexota bacterium]
MDATTAVPLSVAQAASTAGVSTKTIRRWLASGRLEAGRGPDGTWLIDIDALERASITPGPSTDSPALHTGHGQVQSIVQELVRTIERQAGELAQVRLERDQLAGQLRALQAPMPEIAPQRAAAASTVETTPRPADSRRRPWLLRWLPG